MLSHWHEAATTSVGLFWTALWAFGFGYLVSSMIQVFVTYDRMRRTMGRTGPKSLSIATLFGFLSSSCSFAAMATTRSLLEKGAGLMPALAFLLASTNLVVELGIVIALFLGWQFVVGEYAGGALLILLTWLAVRLTYPTNLVAAARKRARREGGAADEPESPDWRKRIMSATAWSEVAKRYVIEWRMVWKDVTIGFTVAGMIATYVPPAFFQSLFVGSGDADVSFADVVLQSLIGPLAAFFTFIGSMGNIPLAAVLFGSGVGFAGIMAFIFSDLVVLPVLRIHARYYGWKMALYIAGVFLFAIVAAALLLHYSFAALGISPAPAGLGAVSERHFFANTYTAYLDIGALILSAAALVWTWRRHGFASPDSDLSERVLAALATSAFAWLAGGLVIPPLMNA
jgi:uncharacterized membrane protein YraQ (UPF0718 family)